MTDTTHKDHEPKLPASAIKSYAETVKIIDGLARRWIRDPTDLFDPKGRETTKIIKGEIAKLRFDSREFRSILNRIARGELKKEQADDLGRLLQDTAGEVYGILLGLTEEHRKFLEERFGMGFYNKIDKEVSEVKIHIREKIAQLSGKRASRESRQELANEILKEIELFNQNLANICDIVRPPKHSANTK